MMSKKLKVLAFGDSLTEGFFNCGFSFHPYAEELKKRLREEAQKRRRKDNDCDGDDAYDDDVMVREEGVSGEFTLTMAMRLRELLNIDLKRETEDEEKQEGLHDTHHSTTNNTESNAEGECLYDIVCILAGTNDLSSCDTAEQIFNRLKELYTLVLSHNPNCLLVTITIPQSYFLDSIYVSRRDAINCLIKQYATQESNKSRVINVDLENCIPYYNEDTGEKDKTLWDDALHMTPKGYDKFGELVFEAIQDKLDQFINR